MSRRGSNGNLALMYAHSYAHYSITMGTAPKKSNYQVTDDCVSNQRQFDAVSATSWISFLKTDAGAVVSFYLKIVL